MGGSAEQTMLGEGEGAVHALHQLAGWLRHASECAHVRRVMGRKVERRKRK